MDAISINWIGGEHLFALKIGQLRALQNACDAGPERILLRILSQDWRVDDLYEIVRLGLIGGGMRAPEAGPMVERLFEQYPPERFKNVAMQALSHAVYGPEDDMPGKPEGAETSPENGDFPTSTQTVQ